MAFLEVGILHQHYTVSQTQSTYRYRAVAMLYFVF